MGAVRWWRIGMQGGGGRGLACEGGVCAGVVSMVSAARQTDGCLDAPSPPAAPSKLLPDTCAPNLLHSFLPSSRPSL